MDIANIFTEDSDLNIIKSWLCNSTDGQTYSISDRFLPRIKVPDDLVWDFINIETEWDEIIGWKHDYKVDDPAMEKAAEAMLARIQDFIQKVNAAPEAYFNPFKPTEQAKVNN